MRYPLTRREFLKDTALAAAAFSTSPVDLQAASSKTLERTGAPKKVIVVGAGLAGLSAAYATFRRLPPMPIPTSG